MSILSTIFAKLGIHKPAAPTPSAPAASVPYEPVSTPMGKGSYTPPSSTPAPAAPPQEPAVPYYNLAHSSVQTPPPPVEMPMVDVMSHLENLAKANPVQGLNWKQSINDLMFLLGMDHSPDAIKALAIELGCPEKEMSDSYSRNVWTYQALMKKIAENGGNIPPELLK